LAGLWPRNVREPGSCPISECQKRRGSISAATLRANPDTRDIPFILATAASIDASNFRLIDGFVVKPFETEVLLAFVTRNPSIPARARAEDPREESHDLRRSRPQVPEALSVAERAGDSSPTCRR
jgi:response regulator RpfG family c-di-GMP phosphodiesterase